MAAKICWVPVIVVAPLLGGLCYVNALQGSFVFDDDSAVVRNPDVCAPSLPLAQLLAHDFWGMPLTSSRSHKSFRPLTTLSFRANCLAHGLGSPLGFHAVNLALHCLCCALAVLCFRRCTQLGGGGGGGGGGDQGSAVLWASLLFASHPVHTEAVASVVGRAELLSAAFFMATFLAYGRATARGTGRAAGALCWLGVAVLAAGATLSKETGVAALLCCAAQDAFATLEGSFGAVDDKAGRGGGALAAAARAIGWARRKDWAALRASGVPRLLLRLLALAALFLAIVGARFSVNGSSAPAFSPGSNPAAEQPARAVRALTFGYTASRHWWLLWWPWPLCCDWSGGSIPLLETAADPRNGSTLAMAAMLAAALAAALRGPSRFVRAGAASSLILSVLPFLPASNLLVHVGFVVAERVLYVPSLGACLAAGVALELLEEATAARAAGGAARKAVRAGALAAVAAFALLTVARNRDWADAEALFSSGVRANPANAKLHWGLAGALPPARAEEAIASYGVAARLQPDGNAALHNGKAVALEAAGRQSEARDAFETARRIDPANAQTLNNLGKLLHGMRLEREAQQAYTAAMKVIMQTRDAYARRAVHERGLSNAKAGAEADATTLALHPEWSSVLNNYGMLMEGAGQRPMAERAYTDSARLDPGNAQSLNNLGKLRMVADRNAEAEQLFQRSLAVKPDYDTALYNLGLVQYHGQRFDEAASSFERAVTSNPRLAAAYNNLAAVHLGRKDTEAAMSTYTRAIAADPTYAMAHAGRGQLHHQDGRLAEAIADYTNALAADPSMNGLPDALAAAQREMAKRTAH